LFVFVETPFRDFRFTRRFGSTDVFVVAAVATPVCRRETLLVNIL
jgi:hypothetical protein